MDTMHALLIAASAFLVGLSANELRHRKFPPSVRFGKPFYLHTHARIGRDLLVITSVDYQLNRPTTAQAQDYSALLKDGRVTR